MSPDEMLRSVQLLVEQGRVGEAAQLLHEFSLENGRGDPRFSWKKVDEAIKKIRRAEEGLRAIRVYYALSGWLGEAVA